MPGVVLGMITYNSVEKLGAGLLRRVLASSLQVPYDAIILVDDSKSDRTRRVFEAFADENGKELLVMRSNTYGYHRPTRATARQTVIDAFLNSFSEEWLFFLDDDFVLNDGWWREAEPHTRDGRVGLVWGVNYDSTPDRYEYLKAMGIDYVKYLIRSFEARGGTHDTLLRRQAIEGIHIPPELHLYEDGYIKWYVQCRGWLYRIVYAGGIHYNPWSPEVMYHNINMMEESIYAAWRYGIVEVGFEKVLKDYGNVVKAFLLIFRPIIGAVALLPIQARRIGFKRHFLRQYLKLKNRWLLFKARVRYGRPPHPCKVIA